MDKKVADLRINYTKGELLESEIHPHPINQFELWFNEAIAADLLEPNAMTLATITPQGTPSARIVLLKAFDHRGFTFFTNYLSQKGQDIAHNSQAALVFWWDKLERQIRIEGTVEKVSDEESDLYFTNRPIASQLGAWTSPQSQIIENRVILETKLEDIKQQYQSQPIPRPPNWGGYRVIPQVIEFWQGRTSRLHDRLRYRTKNQNWIIERLAP